MAEEGDRLDRMARRMEILERELARVEGLLTRAIHALAAVEVAALTRGEL